MLLLQRTGTGRADGCWAPPGGHLEAGEAPLAAALRECAEEVGIRVSPAHTRPVATLVYDDAPGAGLNILFAARLETTVEPLPDPACAAAAAWFDPGALPEPAVPWLPDALARAARIAALGVSDSPWYGEVGEP